MSPLKFGVALLSTLAFAPGASAQTDDARSVTLVLDASGSMKALLSDNTPRMDAAKAAVEQLVSTMPPSSRLSFWAYGHQSPRSEHNCEDVASLAAFDSVANNKAAVIEKTRALDPQGYTPITHALTLAAKDLSSEEAAEHVVVLVSDGKETCKADPCAAAKALAEADAKLVVHTVGVGVDEVTRGQLQCIASNARGSYFDANSAAGLSESLGEAVTKEATVKKIAVGGPQVGKITLQKSGHFTHDVFDSSGKEVAEFIGVTDTVEVPAGIYAVKFVNGMWNGIEVKAGETTELKPGYLELNPLGSEFIEVLEPETGEVVHKILYSDPRATLIPGHFDLKFGELLWPGGVDVKPAETASLQPGVLNVKASEHFGFNVKTADGKPAAEGFTVGHSRIALPPGKYVLEFELETLPEAQRTMNVDLVGGEELEVEMQ
jgi:von Willebrand factor type A domain